MLKPEFAHEGEYQIIQMKAQMRNKKTHTVGAFSLIEVENMLLPF